jgi:transcriptional regulator with PAS, ATPase and Fis domain
MNHDWIREFPGAITVCDDRGTIVEMNDRSTAVFAEDGGRALVGKDVRACHPGESRDKVNALFGRREPNVYTIRKKGVRKLIYQSPWYRDGRFAGVVELSLEIPFDVPEFDRG